MSIYTASVTVVPYGGLANRMKAIESLISLISGGNISANVIWFKDSGLNCSFCDLFEPLKINGLTLKEARLCDYILNDRPRKKNFYIPAFFEKLSYRSCLHEDEVTQMMYANFDFRQWVIEEKKTFLSACTLFYPSDEITRFESFTPIYSLRQQIDEQCNDFLSNHVGVHIRRTDNIYSITESPTDMFIEQMKKEVDNNNETVFYVASDSQEEKEKLISIFGERIITTSKATARDTKEGVQDALVELYTLSRTSKIIGSNFSSFSELAAQIGKIPYYKIKVNP